MTLIEQIKSVATTYAGARALSLSRVSTLAFGDGMKMSAIMDKNADLTTGRFEAAMMFFSENWPANAEWPSDIARPVTQKEAAE